MHGCILSTVAIDTLVLNLRPSVSTLLTINILCIGVVSYKSIHNIKNTTKIKLLEKIHSVSRLKEQDPCFILNPSSLSLEFGNHHACRCTSDWVHVCLLLLVSSGCAQPITGQVVLIYSANHRPGYWSNLPGDWLRTAWAYSEQETENRSWLCYTISRHKLTTVAC